MFSWLKLWADGPVHRVLLVMRAVHKWKQLDCSAAEALHVTWPARLKRRDGNGTWEGVQASLGGRRLSPRWRRPAAFRTRASRRERWPASLSSGWSFYATCAIWWRSTSASILSISGPSGKLLTVAVLLPNPRVNMISKGSLNRRGFWYQSKMS